MVDMPGMASTSFASGCFSGRTMGKEAPSANERAIRIQGMSNNVFASGRFSGSFSRHSAMKLFASVEMCLHTSVGIKT